MNTEAEAIQFAGSTLDEALAGIDVLSHPVYVREGLDIFHGHVRGALGAGEQLLADRAELAQKADLIYPAGAARLAREAQAEAERNGKASLHAARTSIDVLRRAALLGAQPVLDKEREGMARDEFSLLVGEGSPAQLMARVAEIASSGSRDSVSVLNSSFGAALLKHRGLEGQDLSDTLDSAKRIVVESAATQPERYTEAELSSAQLYNSLGELDAAVAATSFALGHLGVSHA